MTLFKNMTLTLCGWLFIMVVHPHFAVGQEPEARRHFKDDSTRAEFYILLEDKKIRHRDTLNYYWFHAQKLHATQQGSAGKILHGPFTRFYHQGQLAEKGAFRYGLKHGTWRSWFPSGNLASEYHYKKGILHGKYMTFDRKGQVLDYGKYRRGKQKSIKEKHALKAARKKEKQEQKLLEESDADSLKTTSSTDTTWFDQIKEIFKADPEKKLARQQKREEKQLERQRKKEANEE